MGGGNGNGRWYAKRDNILMALGIIVVLVELAVSEIQGRDFNSNFLWLASGLFGIGVLQKGDRR